jgi:hypothetical protein
VQQSDTFACECDVSAEVLRGFVESEAYAKLVPGCKKRRYPLVLLLGGSEFPKKMSCASGHISAHCTAARASDERS